MTSVVEALVPGGKATAGPPLGPALGPLGVNIKAVVDKINEETASYNGMQVPVKVIVDDKKQFTIEVGVPPTSALVLAEAGLEKGSGDGSIVGNLTMEQVVKIAEMKRKKSYSKSLKALVREIMGTCLTMGITIEGMPAKAAQQAVLEGKFDSILAEEKET